MKANCNVDSVVVDFHVWRITKELSLGAAGTRAMKDFSNGNVR